MIYCFDTSAINRLHDDPERQFLVAGLLATNTLRVSALNVIEAVGTEDEVRRRSLIVLLQRLSHGFRPLATPNTLLKIVVKAHARGDDRLNITSPEEEDSIWIALNSPDELDEETRQEVFQWKTSLEGPFIDAHREARPQLQTLFESGQAERPKSVADVIRYFRDNDQTLLESMQDVYQHCTGQPVSLDQARMFLHDIPYWPLYYAGWAHAIYSRAIKSERYGVRGKPGTIDLWCAIYLPDCNIFVTDDIPQRRALRLLNVLIPKRARIMSYAGMRARLLVKGTRDEAQVPEPSANNGLLMRTAQCD